MIFPSDLGPKPATVLHSRKVRIDCAASDPFTTHEVLAAMHGTPLRGKRVVVQRYGETNRELQAALESEGADVTEIVTYRWGFGRQPADYPFIHIEQDRQSFRRHAFSHLKILASPDRRARSLSRIALAPDLGAPLRFPTS